MESDGINGFLSSYYSCTLNEIMLLIGTSLLLLILLAEFIDPGTLIQPHVPPPKPRRKPVSADKETFEYGYEEHNGPHVWKFNFPEAQGNRQSPINITSKNALVSPVSRLSWSCEYTVVPHRIRILNDGHCVVLQAKYSGPRPSISGGPLPANYDLYTIRFRWGPTDDEGSEHTIDYKRYALEMQAFHIKSGFHCDKASSSDISENIIVISYIFQPTTIDNPYLDPILSKLDRIRYPGFSSVVPSFPLSWLMPSFLTDYYMYQGSLTYPPCTEGIQWIIQPEPMAMSPRQVRKFRKLITKKDGKMLSNTRPVQCLNNRDVFYFTSSE